LPVPQDYNVHSRVRTDSVADDDTFENLLTVMKKAAAALRDNDIDVALAGGLAVYARGGPATEHDVDFMIRAEDAEHAIEVLTQIGFRAERPPEGWLYKVFDENGSMIDLIFAPNSKPEVVPEILERAEVIEIYAITMKVMTVADVLATKLLTLKEHEVDYESVLEIARSCREQIDWDLLRSRTAESPYAKAFFTLAEELGLAA
jgi:predicted nucleotidyltransferase